MNKSPFYLVWNPAGYPPKYRHDTYKNAEQEATRLARLHPGQKFYVLAVACEAVCNDVTITRYQQEDDDEISF